MGEALLSWCTLLASNPAGVRTAWSWAFFEAILLPLPPEILLIPLALAHPQRAFVLALSAVAGSLMGGLVSYVLGRRFGERAVATFKHLPGVNADQVLWASSRLRQSSARFIAISPWLVLPYKITSVLSGRHSIAWWRYLLGGAVGRGTRLVIVTMAVAGGAQLNEVFVRSHTILALVIAYVVVAGVVWTARRGLLVLW